MTQRSLVAAPPRVGIAPPAPADEAEFVALRRESRSFHTPWEAALPRGIDPAGSEAFRLFRGRAHDPTRRRFLVRRAEDRVLLGALSLVAIRRGAYQSAELGYWIGERHTRRGYMGEALGLVVAEAFGPLRLRRLEALVLPENEASRALLRRAGFECEGIARAYARLGAHRRDHERWALTVDAWRRGTIDPSRAGSGSPG